MSVEQQNPDGSWGPARAAPYPWDPRPTWKKLLELPFRMAGIITYDPMVDIPIEEVVEFKKTNFLSGLKKEDRDF